MNEEREGARPGALGEYLSFWNRLTPSQQDALNRAAKPRAAKAGTLLHNGSEDCVGLLIVVSGLLRAFILSDEGREITLYRLFERDLCLFSASCMMSSIQFDIAVEAERDSEILHIPTAVWKGLMQESAPVANYTNQVMATRFSDVMWLLDQILYKRLDARLAAFLLEESGLDGGAELRITHETVARHLGSAREVVTRMLKYFQSEGLVSLSRGGIALADRERLRALAGDSLR